MCINMEANGCNCWEKKLRFILLVMSDFYMIDSLSIAVHAFASHMLMSMQCSLIQKHMLYKFKLSPNTV